MEAKRLKWIGWFGWGIVAALALIFYRERILYTDTAYYLFHLTNTEWFFFGVERYGAFPTQIPVLLLIQLGVSLKGLAVVYSLSFVALQAGLSALAVHRFRMPWMGLAMLLTFILTIQESFYHTVTETHQAMAWSLFFMAWLWFRKDRRGSRADALTIAVALLAILFCFANHPVTVFTLGFIIVYFMIDTGRLFDKRILFFLGFIFLIYLLKYLLQPEDSYEGDQFSQFALIFELLPSITSWHPFKFFAVHFTRLYLFLTLLWVLTLAGLLLQKKYLLAGWVFLATLGVFFITGLAYNRGDSDIMMEKNFPPIALMVVVPFFKEVFSGNWFSVNLRYGLLILVIGVSLGRIAGGSKWFTQRQTLTQTMLERGVEEQQSKLITLQEQLPVAKFKVTWAFACESLIQSALEGPDKAATIYLANSPEQLEELKATENAFLMVDWWKYWPEDQLNPRYYKLRGKQYKVYDPCFY